MKLVIATAAALVGAHAGAYKRSVTAGFCDGQLAGNYQHDTEAPENGFFYTCATDDDVDPIVNMCPQADVMDDAGVVSKEQLVYNPNNGNADCSIVSPGGYCDFAENVDFTTDGGVDASIDCTAGSGDDGSGAVTTTTAVTTTVAATEPAGYSATFCQSLGSGNQIFADSCAEGYYYQCANGLTYLMQCPTGTVFSPSLGTCDWSDDVSDCAAAATTTTAAVTTTMDSGSGAITTTTAAATTTVSEVDSCDYDWESPTFGECTTTNWCNGKSSGFYAADSTAECDAGTYYSCNMGVFTELACGAGTRWYVPNPLPAWATQWYGYCNDAADVTC